MKRIVSAVLERNHGCNVIFYNRSIDIALLCLLLALIPQLLGIAMFKHTPNWAAVIDLSMYALGVVVGCWVAWIVSPQREETADTNYVFSFSLNEKLLLLLTTILFLPLFPDAILSFTMSQQTENVRYYLLTDNSVRFLDNRLIIIFSQPVVLLVWFYFVYFNQKTMWIALAMAAILLMETFLWASRTEFVLLGVFYLVNSKKLLSKENIVLVVGIFLLVSIYTAVIQGRTDLDSLAEATLFYSIYYAYPIYLHSFIPVIFNDLTIPYALFGYPADIIETSMAGLHMLARHMEEIATYSIIGEDITGTVHDKANVLYPHYGFLGATVGHLGVFAYYAFSIGMICIFAEKFKKYTFAWRILIFLFVYSSSRAFAFGVPNNWLFLIAAFLFCLIFIKSAPLRKV